MRGRGKRWWLLGFAVAALALGTAGPAVAMPTTSLNFAGMSGGAGGSGAIAPPDVQGAAGPNDYVQAVNTAVEVFSKAGTVLLSAKLLSGLWSGYVGTNAGNGCATHNDGQPIVRYDRQADRWVITQVSTPNMNNSAGPSFECVAVSKTGDPTGGYYLYDFRFAGAYLVNPSVGVWPDAYYFTAQLYTATSFAGDEVCAWDRPSMLAGHPASQQCFLQLAPPAATPACPAAQPFYATGVIPANLDGSLPPPSGSPGYLMQFDYSPCGPTYNQLDLWKFHVDWTTPANSTLSGPTAISVANFTPACYSSTTYTSARNCVVQGSGQPTLDGNDTQLSDRLVYRNYGDHESLLLNHSVQDIAGGLHSDVRWYEIRSPGSSPTVYQQGNYYGSGSLFWRWDGSIAADQAGDIALGYSIAGAPNHPSMAWTGRLATDPLGTMGQGEATVDSGGAYGPAAGAGSTDGPWGTGSSMTIDPSDDCTFWYTNELYRSPPTPTLTQWSTYIASVKFPNCGLNDFSIAGPAGISAGQGMSGSTTVSTAVTKGVAQTVTLGAWDLPPGATASFNPASVSAGGNSTLTLTAGPNTPPGTYTVHVSGSSPSALHDTTLTFTVTPYSPPPGNGGGGGGSGGGGASGSGGGSASGGSGGTGTGGTGGTQVQSRQPACFGLSGHRLIVCRAKIKRAAALAACARLKPAKRRVACVAAANRAYNRAVSVRRRGKEGDSWKVEATALRWSGSLLMAG